MPPTPEPDAQAGDARTPKRMSHAAWLFLGAAIIGLAFSLRLIFPSLSVLLPEITDRLGLSASGAGYLTTLPVLCLGVFAPLAPWCARRFGMERTLLGVLLALVLGTALRGYHGLPMLFLGTGLAGAAIAVANVLLPALVKRDFAHHVAGMTALYTMTLNAGAAVAAALTLPLADAADHSWRAGVAAWALPPLVAAIIWVPQLRHRPLPTGQIVQRVRGLWHSALAWQVTLFMGLQSAMAYCVTGWLAPILRARGLDGTTAGVVTSVCIVMNAIGCLGAPLLIARCKDQRALNVGLSVLAGAPLLGLLFAPLSTVWFWAVLQGLGQGSMFTTALTVIALRSPTPRVTAQLSSMAQTIGYIVASAGPLTVGLLHGWTGGFAASGWLFAALMLGGSLSGWGAGRRLYVSATTNQRP